MIPLLPSDLDVLADVARSQEDEILGLLSEGDESWALWRPDPTRWSLTGHAAHLCVVNGRYLESIATALDEGRARGIQGGGPWRHPRIACWFAKSQEPPPKRRMKTFRSMVPDPEAEPGRVGQDIRVAQQRLVDLLGAADGLDLGRIRFGSPFLSLVRLSVGTAFALLEAHNRRHIWLMREVNRIRSQG